MNEREEKRRIQQALNRTLSGLQENPFLAQRIIAHGKGKTRMKKKLSLGLIAALIILATTTTALAATLLPSGILRSLFKTEENAPQDMVDLLNQQIQIRQSSAAALTLDEYLFDGGSLHLGLTLKNPTDNQTVYLIGQIKLNGRLLRLQEYDEAIDTLNGLCLGGQAEGRALPTEVSLYARADQLLPDEAPFSTPPPAMDRAPSLPQQQPLTPMNGAVLTVRVDAYRPVAEPILCDRAYKIDAKAVYETGKLPVRLDGHADLFDILTRNDKAANALLTDSADLWAAAQEVYAAAGWLQYLGTDEFSFTVDLKETALPQVAAASASYQVNGCTLTLNELKIAHSGGSLRGEMRCLLPDGAGLEDLSRYVNFQVMTEEAALAHMNEQNPLAWNYTGALAGSAGVSTVSEEGGVLQVEITQELRPVAKLPAAVYLVWMDDAGLWDWQTAIRVELQ